MLINKILVDNQYGFRRNHLTSLALLHLVDQIYAAIDDKLYTIGVFLYLSRAFDTVNMIFYLINLSFMGSVVWPKTGYMTILQIDSIC